MRKAIWLVLLWFSPMAFAQQRVQIVGDVTVTQSTGSNTHIVVDSGTVSTITNPVTVTGTVNSTVSQSTASNLNATVVQGTASSLKAEVVGTLTNNGAAPTTTQFGALTVLANAAQPTITEGRQALLSTNLKGDLRTMICDAALNDRCANVNSSNYLQVVSPPIIYNSTQPTVTNGQTTDFQISTRGELKIVNMDAAGNARGANVDANNNMGVVLAAETTKVIGTINIAASQTVGLVAGTALVGSVVPYAGGTLVSGTITSAMTGTTSTSLVSGTASNYLYITSCTASNGDTDTSTDILLQDGNGGTTLWVIPAPAAAVISTGGGGAHITFPVPLKVPTSGNSLYAANVTTGASTKISCNGYKSTVSY